VNIPAILLVILGLVLVTTIVLSATALASVLILGALYWKWVVLAAGLWLLLLGRIFARDGFPSPRATRPLSPDRQNGRGPARPSPSADLCRCDYVGLTASASAGVGFGANVLIAACRAGLILAASSSIIRLA
jgi:hypothetical protein